VSSYIPVVRAALIVFLGSTSAPIAGTPWQAELRSAQDMRPVDWPAERAGKLGPKTIGPAGSAKAMPPASCPTVRTIGAGSAIVKGPWAPWGVQVAGSFTLERTLASFEAIQRKYPSIVTGSPLVICSLDRGHGQVPLFQIRLPAPDLKQALNICSRLEAAGGACIVLGNGRELAAGA